MKTHPIRIAALASVLLSGTSFALTPVNEKFSGTKLDPAVWFQFKTGKASLRPENHKLNFIVASNPTNDDYASIELRTSQPGYNESWQLILDLANTSGLGTNAACGIMLFNTQDRDDYLYLQFHGKQGGVNAGVFNNGKHVTNGQTSLNPGVSKGSIRIRFDKATKRMTLHVSPPAADEGYKWARIGTFSPTGSGGNINANWNMNPGSGRFGVWLFGFAQNNKVPSGKVTLDNLVITARP